MTGTRRAIALKMAMAAAQAVTVTLLRDIDVTCVARDVAARRADDAPRLLDVVLSTVARTLRMHRALNAHLLPQGLIEHDWVHLGYAVDGARGLVVPVIQNADRLTIRELARCRRALVAHAMAGLLAREDAQGATFTVSNLGTLQVQHFTPIVVPPQVAILGVGAVRKVLDVGDDDRPVVAQKLGVSLSFDHRGVDSAPAARFLAALAAALDSDSGASQLPDAGL